MSPASFWLVIIVATLVAGCQPHQADVVVNGRTMGTTFTVRVADCPLPDCNEQLDARITARLTELNSMLSHYDPESNLNWFRELIRIRNGSPALKYGDFRLLRSPDGLLAFTRSTPEEKVYGVFNLSTAASKWKPRAAKLFMAASIGFEGKIDKVPASLPAFSGYVATTGTAD